MARVQVRTVADLVAALQALPQDLPVFAGCHYDNDDGLTTNVVVSDTHVAHSEDRFYAEVEPSWGWAGTIRAVTIT